MRRNATISTIFEKRRKWTGRLSSLGMDYRRRSGVSRRLVAMPR